MTMMQEICLRGNSYLYQTKNELYYTKHQVFSEKSLKHSNQNVLLLAYKKKDDNGKDVYVLSSHKSLLLLGYLYLQNDFVKEIPDFQKCMEEYPKDLVRFLQKIERISKKYASSHPKQNELISKLLFRNFSDKTTAFLQLAFRCIDENPTLTDEEKNLIWKELSTKINVYGKYYEERIILKSLIGYATVAVKFLPNYYKSCFKSNGYTGTIIYNTKGNKMPHILNHELSHAELMTLPTSVFFDEARASLLSKSGYDRVRALMTMLSLLGDEEVILKSLVNNHTTKIWNHLRDKNASKDAEILEIKSVFDQMSSSSQINEVLNRNPEIIKKIESIYDSTHRFSHFRSPKFAILQMAYESNSIFQVNDIRTQNNQISISLNYDIILEKKEILLHLKEEEAYQSVECAKLQLIQEYLKGEEEIARRYPNVKENLFASYWIRLALSDYFYEQFLYTSNPDVILGMINYNLKSSHIVLSSKDFYTLIQYTNCKEVYQGIKETNFFKIIRKFNQETSRLQRR